VQEANLTGALTHLPPLATKTPHPLLPPLGSHTSLNIEKHGDFVVIFEAKGGKSTVGKVHVAGDETDKMLGDELLVLDHGFEVRDGGGALDRVGGGGAGGCYDDLHIFGMGDNSVARNLDTKMGGRG
jgi:hypothetical protein